jgi:hypothetical protein
LTDAELKVLPLVDDHGRTWRAGWCTYSTDFARNPDVEVFCGGVNAKTPTAAAIWRQGNLLHYGFEQSPAEMNETGQLLLLNSIAYISRFTEDRPIAITPSVFAGPVARFRATPARWLRNPGYEIDFGKDLVTPEIWQTMFALGDREKMAKWADEHSPYFYPNAQQVLDIDTDLAVLKVSFDVPEFFDKTIAAMRSDDPDSRERGRRLLARYVPIGPREGTAEQWAKWWNDNRPFAFASDAGDYRWYIDPLAKKRNVPERDLRGPLRADRPATTVSVR